jgi:hypothetical protein
MSAQGDDLGELRSTARSWPVGEVVTLATGDSFVVIGVTDALDGDAVDAYLVVRPLEAPAA